MNQYYEVSVLYTKEFNDGTLKRVSEPYLISALSFGEAEKRIYEEVGEFVRGEFLVKQIKPVDYADVFVWHEEKDINYYKCKVTYKTENADTGKEVQANNYFLITGRSTKEALTNLKESLKDMLFIWECTQITKTKIADVIPYEPAGDDQEEEENNLKTTTNG